ncbi:30S ribosomal protein S9 [Patescibacteria group bacterium]|nr:30S ribosomal protein S9 [Patescibacteria group bacterium]
MTTDSKVKKTIKKTTAKTLVKKTVVKDKVKKVSVTSAKPVVKVVAKKTKQTSAYLSSVGRRKAAIARVRLYRQGTGQITINGLSLAKYFPAVYEQEYVLSPLVLVGLADKVDITVKVVGGGKKGQREAVRHGVARSLIILSDEDYRKPLRTAGFLTRDSRVKERKKYGLKKARRAPQWQKR